MIPINIIFWILVSHYLADYVLQTRFQANNKSTSLLVLLDHIASYTSVLAITSIWWLARLPADQDQAIGLWILSNMVAHLGTDIWTSKLVKYLWANKQEYLTFVIMGLDQLLHLGALFGTWVYFFN